jgi:hypothetical protein
MTSKVIKLREKTITVYEPKGFFGKPQITEQKAKFDQDCKTLLTLFAKFAKVNKLPKNSQEIIDWIGQSYKNTEGTFITRKPKAVVLDIDYVLDQMVK